MSLHSYCFIIPNGNLYPAIVSCIVYTQLAQRYAQNTYWSTEETSEGTQPPLSSSMTSAEMYLTPGGGVIRLDIDQFPLETRDFLQQVSRGYMYVHSHCPDVGLLMPSHINLSQKYHQDSISRTGPGFPCSKKYNSSSTWEWYNKTRRACKKPIKLLELIIKLRVYYCRQHRKVADIRYSL